MKILAISGSMRKGGVTDTLVDAVLEGARAAGAEAEKVFLPEEPLEFCRNCRACTQAPGAARGRCVIDDGLAGLLDRCEAADGLVIGSPVNFFNINAVTRRFLERLVCYAYWPWGQLAPKPRPVARRRPAVLVTASAMPSLLGRVFTGAVRALKMTAETMGCETRQVIYAGIAAQQERPGLSPRLLEKARRAGAALAAGGKR